MHKGEAMSQCINNAICRIISLFLFISTFTLFAHAQEPSMRKDIYFWISPGIGLGSMGQGTDLALGFSISYQTGNLIITGRAAKVSEIMQNVDDVYDYALTIGYSTKTPGSAGYVSISGGISYVRGYQWGSGDISTIGLPIEVNWGFTPLLVAGIGFQVIANINPARSFFGLLLCLQTGKLR